MNKAFVKDDLDRDDDEADVETLASPSGAKNYMTRAGFSRLQAELKHLVEVERVEVVGIVSWAAGNGDRSENGDYIYGKKRLRAIDCRIRFLTRRLASAERVDATVHTGDDRIYFGATVTIADEAGKEHRYRIVGIDETDVKNGDISWISPLAKALLGKALGDEVDVITPGGLARFEITRVDYLPDA